MKSQDIIDRAAALGIEVTAEQADVLCQQITSYVEEECGCIPEPLVPYMPDMALAQIVRTESGAGPVTSIKEGDSSVTYAAGGGVLKALEAGFDMLARFRVVKW